MNKYTAGAGLKGKDFAGPSGWNDLHCKATTYTPDKEKYALMLVNEVIPNLFSCAVCRTHWSQLIKEMPVEPYLGNNHDFFFWTYLAHDYVNQQVGKVSPPYLEVKTMYFKALGEECGDCSIPNV
jgi:hypothetical protein